MASRRGSSRSKKKAMDPSAFFGSAVPLLLGRMKAMCQERGGRFVVDVEGAGAWTIDFGEAAVREGADADADVTLKMSGATFTSLSGAKVELRKLVVDGDVACEGERERIEDLSLVLAFLQ